MDGTTETIIVVIGNPIAGNPSQFAVERALRSLSLDWRVLSFEVKPEDIPAALDGFAVTGIAGVLVDPSVSDAASRWYADKQSTDEEASDETSDNTVSAGPLVIDCMYRDDEQNFVGSWEQQTWVDQCIAKHGGEHRIWFGDAGVETLSSREGFAQLPTPEPPEPDLIAHADLIVIAENASGPVLLEVEDWPADDGSTLVLDLTNGHPDQPAIKQLGYRVVTRLDRRIGTLQGCLQRWTGKTPSKEVIQDAIEEYLGV